VLNARSGAQTEIFAQHTSTGVAIENLTHQVYPGTPPLHQTSESRKELLNTAKHLDRSEAMQIGIEQAKIIAEKVRALGDAHRSGLHPENWRFFQHSLMIG
jgi:hypothetical protein